MVCTILAECPLNPRPEAGRPRAYPLGQIAFKTKGAWIALTVHDNEHWDAVSLAVRVLTPTIRVLRPTDGKTGATLGKVYGLCAELDALYRNDIDGMDCTWMTKYVRGCTCFSGPDGPISIQKRSHLRKYLIRSILKMYLRRRRRRSFAMG